MKFIGINNSVKQVKDKNYQNILLIYKQLQ